MSEAEASICLGRPQHSCSVPVVQSCPPNSRPGLERPGQPGGGGGSCKLTGRCRPMQGSVTCLPVLELPLLLPHASSPEAACLYLEAKVTLEACPESQVRAPVALKGCCPALPVPKAIGPLSHRLLAAFHLGSTGYLLREGSRAVAGELASACAPGEGDPHEPSAFPDRKSVV